MTDFLEPPSHRRQQAADRRPPLSWSQFRREIKHRWAVPFLVIDWLSQWASYGLSRWSILELLETCSSFTLLIGVILYFVDAPERTKTKHYQAWQVINTAQGKGGSGGRIDALHELNEDHVPLVGVDVSDSFLQGVRLEQADLSRGNFHGADLRGADLTATRLEEASFTFANLRNARLIAANLTDAAFSDADLVSADLSRANLHGVDFERADLRGANLAGVVDWQTETVRLANIHDVRNAPDGYLAWAIKNGAVDLPDDRAWDALLTSEPASPSSTQPATQR